MIKQRRDGAKEEKVVLNREEHKEPKDRPKRLFFRALCALCGFHSSLRLRVFA
jgi:hypothetical protein